jgi:excisionase family DNA binding protein
MRPTNVSELIDVEEAARRLGVSRWTLYKRVAAGEVASYNTGSRLLFDPDDVAEHLQRRRRPAAAERPS